MSVSGQPSTVQVPAGGQALISFNAQVLANATNASGIITVTCTSTTNPSLTTTGTMSFTVTGAAGAAAVLITAPQVTGPYPVSQPITLQFTIQNEEAINDIFNLTATSSNPNDMPVQLGLTSIPLNQGQSAQVQVTVTPDTTMYGADVSVTLTATAQSNPAITAQGYASFSIIPNPTLNQQSTAPYSESGAVSTPDTDPSAYDQSYDPDAAKIRRVQQMMVPAMTANAASDTR